MAFDYVKSFLLLLLTICSSFQLSSQIKEQRNEIEETRRTKTRPNLLGPPTVVSVSVFLSQLFSVDLASMTIGVDLYLREEWEDERVVELVDHNVILPLESANAFWTPDTYFQNQIVGSLPSVKQGYIHVRKNGQIKSEKRMAVTASCTMDIHMFPFDTQSCALILESYAFSNEDLILRWIRKDINPPYEMTPIGFTILSTSTVDRTRHYTTGNYSELLACINFRRNSGHYALLLFFPVSSLVIVGWILSWSYWNATFAEFVLLLIAILGVHMFFRFRLASVVSYITLTDFYIFVCFMLVFLCLCKVLLWKCLSRRRKKADERNKTVSTRNNGTYSAIPYQKRRKSFQCSLSKPQRPYRVIHVISHLFLLIVLCVCFALLVLWPTIGGNTKIHSNC